MADDGTSNGTNRMKLTLPWGTTFEGQGRQLAVVVAFVAVMVMAGLGIVLTLRSDSSATARLEAQHGVIEKKVDGLNDNLEALVWTNLPPDLRARMPVPKWVRVRLEAEPQPGGGE